MTSNAPERMPAGELGIAQRTDAYTLSYTCWTAAVFLWALLSIELEKIFDHGFLLIPVTGFSALILVGTLIIGLGVNAFRRRWRRAISIVAAPLITGSFFYLLGHMGVTTELIRLELWKSHYLARIAELPVTDGAPRLAVWQWGSIGGVATSNIFWTLIYDESDQVSVSPALWSADWIRRADQAGKGNGFQWFIEPHGPNITVRRLDGHFYVVEEID